MDFTKILEKATNEELEKLFNTVMSMDFISKWNYLSVNVTNAFTSEVKNRLSNGTMKRELSTFPTDWDLFVSCCKG